jgi:hypothetical protein
MKLIVFFFKGKEPMKKISYLILFLIVSFLVSSCATIGKRDLRDLSELKEQAGGKWSDYGTLSSGNIASGDTFLIRDISDTTLGATGTQKQYPWATMLVDLGTIFQPYDADLTIYAGITPSADVQTMLGSADDAAIRTNIGAPFTTSVDCSGTTEGCCSDSGGFYCWDSDLLLLEQVGAADFTDPVFTGMMTGDTGLTLPNGAIIKLSGTSDEDRLCFQAYNGAAFIDVLCIVADTGGLPRVELQANAALSGLGTLTMEDTGVIQTETDTADDYAQLQSTKDPAGSPSQVSVLTWGNTGPNDTPGGKLRLSEYNADELSDTTTPHGLIALEVTGTLLNNYAASPEAKTFNLPAAAQGYNFILQLGVAQNVVIDPDGTEIIYLNGASLGAGVAVENTSPTIGECITCWTIQTGASTWGWNCRSADADFVTQ